MKSINSLPRASFQAFASSTSVAEARLPSRTKPVFYGARLRVFSSQFAAVGSVATMAALHLPLTAVYGSQFFEDACKTAASDDDELGSFVKACLKGACFALLCPVALGLAAAMFAVSVAAQIFCVPYALFASPDVCAHAQSRDDRRGSHSN